MIRTRCFPGVDARHPTFARSTSAASMGLDGSSEVTSTLANVSRSNQPSSLKLEGDEVIASTCLRIVSESSVPSFASVI